MTEIDVILDTIHELAFVNIGNKDATIDISIKDLDSLRLYVLKLERENCVMKKNIESKDFKLTTLRSQLVDLDMKLSNHVRMTRPKFDDYKRGRIYDSRTDC